MNLLIGSIFILFIGGLILSFVIVNFRKGAARKTWPNTPGEIIASEVTVHTTHGEDGTTSYHPEVRYRYQVSGISYESSRITASAKMLASLSERSAEAVVKQYPVNRKVDVYYDPNNPQTAALDPSTSSDSLVILATIGTVVLLIGLALLRFYLSI